MTKATTIESSSSPSEKVRNGVRKINSVLVTANYQDDHLQSLRQTLAPAEFIHLASDDKEGIATALGWVDVAILSADLDERYLNAPNLKWIHCDHAGLNGSAKPKVFERGLIVTGSAGRAAPALAQHVFFFALGLTYDTPGLEEMKRRRRWRSGVDFTNRRSLLGKTMGIIGLGATGLETARLAKALGMKVLAYKKSVIDVPDSVDTLYCADRSEGIDEILAESDFVVLAIRLTDETYHMIGQRELGTMKASAYLINIARGPVVDEPALVKALHDQTIAGAGLDVFEQEPLPADAPIWDAPNTIITPHATSEVPDLEASSLKIISENIVRYRLGKEMLNQLKPEDVYTK